MPAQPKARLPIGTPVAIVGDSMTYGDGDGAARSYMPGLILAASGRFHYPETINKGSNNTTTTPPQGGNMGVSGQTSAQYVQRLSAITAGVGSGVMILGGIENDFAQSITVEQSIANFEQIVAAVPDAKRIYITPVAPTKTVVVNGKGPAKAAFDAHFAAHPDPRVRFLSGTWDGITLSNPDASPGPHGYDAVHQTPLGGKLQGFNMWRDMAADWAAGTAYDDATLGADLLGTSGDFAGGTTLATGWAITKPAGAVVTNSVFDGGLDGRRTQRTDVSGTATASLLRLRRSLSFTFAAGARFAGLATLRLTNGAGNGPAVGVKGFGLEVYFANARWLTASYSGTQGAFADVTPLDGIVRTFVSAPAASGGTTLTVDLAMNVLTGVPLDARLDVAGVRAFAL